MERNSKVACLVKKKIFQRQLRLMSDTSGYIPVPTYPVFTILCHQTCFGANTGHTQGPSGELTAGVGPEDRTSRTGLCESRHMGRDQALLQEQETWPDTLPGRDARTKWGQPPSLPAPVSNVACYTL